MLWRDQAYAHISRKKLDDIYRSVASRELQEFCIDRFYLIGNGSGLEYSDIIKLYIHGQRKCVAVLKKHGPTVIRPFVIAIRVAEEELRCVQQIEGERLK